jgi:uncharacterized protein (DUF1800 family)
MNLAPALRTTQKSAPRLAALSAAFLLAACGSGDPEQSAAPPGAPPAATVSDDPTREEAARFLMQATFGPTEGSINELVDSGYSRWFRDQLNADAGATNVDRMRQIQAAFAARGETANENALAEIVWADMIDARDQLRQRMSFALSQILVVSYANGDVAETESAVAFYMDVLDRNAFGNYRVLIEDVTYSPSMAQFLTYLNNRNEDPSINRVPDENYARELMQLFTIGLVELNRDGTLRLDSAGQPIETYDNADITGLAKVFTGLSWDDGEFGGRFPSNDRPVATYSPLAVYPEHHSTSEKAFLNVTIPANTDAATSIDRALDALFTHDNAAPFLARQMIQRFVTSNPSPAYVSHVAAAFETGWFRLPDGSTIGSQTRGDLTATLAAVLFDDEARLSSGATNTNFGKVREPVIRFVHWARVAGLNSSSVLGANGLGGQDDLLNTSGPGSLNQQGYRSPSVFNFFSPSYSASGYETAGAGLVAPELQITTTTTVTGFANFMRRRIEEARPDRTFAPDYGAELALADRPDALIDRLNLEMTAGSMSPEMRAEAAAAVASVPIVTNEETASRRRRVNAAMHLIVLSPDFYVQR